MLLAVPAAVLGIRIARARRRFLTQRILVGVPEISNSDRGRLITDGIYGRVRNPRYLEFILLSFVYVAFVNYRHLGDYTMMFPAHSSGRAARGTGTARAIRRGIRALLPPRAAVPAKRRRSPSRER